MLSSLVPHPVLSWTVSFYPLSDSYLKVIRNAIQLKLLHLFSALFKKVQVGKDQEKAQSEKDSHSKNRGGKKHN